MPKKRQRMEKEPAMHNQAAPSSSTLPTVLTQADVRQLLNQMITLVQKLSDGTIRVEEEAAPVVRKPTIREERAARLVNTEPPMPSSVVQPFGLHDIPEPRRQRKLRNLPPRRSYMVKPVQTAAQLGAIQRELTPAATSVLVYLANHPHSTVPDLVASLDLKRKTVENVLSILSQKDLILSEVC